MQSRRGSSILNKRVARAANAVDHEMRGLDRAEFLEAVATHSTILDATDTSETLVSSKRARTNAAVVSGIAATLNSLGAKDQTLAAMIVKDTVMAAAVASSEGAFKATSLLETESVRASVRKRERQTYRQRQTNAHARACVKEKEKEKEKERDDFFLQASRSASWLPRSRSLGVKSHVIWSCRPS